MKKYIILLTCVLVCTNTLYARDKHCDSHRGHHHRSGPNKEWSAVLGFIAGAAVGSHHSRGHSYNYRPNTSAQGYYRTVYDRRWVPGRCERVWDSCGQCYVTVRKAGTLA